MSPRNLASASNCFWLNLVTLAGFGLVFSYLIDYIFLSAFSQLECTPLHTRLKFNFDVFQFIWLGLISFFFIAFIVYKKSTRNFSIKYPIQFCVNRNDAWLWLINLGSISVMGAIHQKQGWCFMGQIDYRFLLFTWMLALSIWTPSSLALLISPKNFMRLIIDFKKNLLGTLFFSFLLSSITAVSFKDISIEGFVSYSLLEPTIFFMSQYFTWLGMDLVADIQSKVIGINSFMVEVGPACLGYKGMGILTFLIGFYLYRFKDVLRFPNVLLIFPVILILLLLTNSLRMVLLLLVGAYISPEIASIGFHSAAGWINIFAIGFLALYCLTRLSFFTRQKSVFRIHLTDDTARLVPELVLISLSLLFLLVNNGFDWAYPLRIVLAGLVIKYLWKRLNIRFRPFDWKVLLIGIASLFIWILIVKNDLTKSHEFAAHLFSAQTWQTYIWMIFRILGASLVIPIAEELFFRGYMFDAIKYFLKDTSHKIRKNYIDILTLVITSILFGWLHSQWMAGFLVGLLFGLARLYRHRISDAIIAHAATNFLLALYVVYFEAWSLW